MFRLALGSLLALLIFSCSLPAAAAGTGASADDLVKQGLELRRIGRDAAALEKFEAAYKASKSPRAAAQWGLCLQAVSRWAEADPLLSEALSAKQDPWIKRNREVLKESQEAVKAHVGRIEVVGDPEGAAVLVGGRTVGNFPLETAITVNEGSVDVEVASPGFKRTVRTLMVSGASYQQVVIRLEKIDAPAPQRPVATSDAGISSGAIPVSAKTSDPAPEGGTPLLRNPWFWAGVGVVIIGAATAVLLTSGTEYPSTDLQRPIR